MLQIAPYLGSVFHKNTCRLLYMKYLVTCECISIQMMTKCKFVSLTVVCRLNPLLNKTMNFLKNLIPAELSYAPISIVHFPFSFSSRKICERTQGRDALVSSCDRKPYSS